MADIPQDLADLAARNGYHLERRSLVYKRGWPQRSAKPFLLYHKGGAFIAAFASVPQLERNLRARAGC